MASSYLATKGISSSRKQKKIYFSAWVRFNLNELANNSEDIFHVEVLQVLGLVLTLILTIHYSWLLLKVEPLMTY